MKTEYEGLRELRESLLGYSLPFASRMSGIPVERLSSIEAGDPPTLWELDKLSLYYGVDAERLEDEPIRLAPGDGILCLTSLEEYRTIAESIRLRIVLAANAARDLAELEEFDRWSAFARDVPRWRPRNTSGAPHRQGADLAQQLRRHYGQGLSPLVSVRDFVRDCFPQIAVLYSDFGEYGPAGVSFADRLRGPTIVLNTRGKNINPCVRRFSLAHELAHLLFDWNRQQALVEISGYLSDSALEVERRANAFAVRLLCPEAVVRKLTSSSSPLEIERALRPYGLPQSAARLYLKNEGGHLNEPAAAIRLSGVGTEPEWVRAEEPVGIDGFPLNNVASERRTLVARRAAESYAAGKISRDRFASYLGITPASPVEQVLDYFVLSQPTEDNAA